MTTTRIIGGSAGTHRRKDPFVALFEIIDERFDEEELRELCFRLEGELGIDYDNLSGRSKTDKARELVRYCKRHGQIEILAATVRDMRPQLEWPTFRQEHQVFTKNTTKIIITIEVPEKPSKQLKDTLDLLVLMITALLTIKPHEVKIVNVESGSIVVTLEMFVEHVAMLLTHYRRDPGSLSSVEQGLLKKARSNRNLKKPSRLAHRLRRVLGELAANFSTTQLPRIKAIAVGNTESEQVDLSGCDFMLANLHGADLSMVNLHKADLRAANLLGANLTRADLTEANLMWADLFRADLTEANLTKASLNEADLRRANLTEADLTMASLAGADLSRANMTAVNLTKAILAQANLRWTKLTEANLTEADLRWAEMTAAFITNEQLSKAKDLQGTILPDSVRHPSPPSTATPPSTTWRPQKPGPLTTRPPDTSKP